MIRTPKIFFFFAFAHKELYSHTKKNIENNISKRILVTLRKALNRKLFITPHFPFFFPWERKIFGLQFLFSENTSFPSLVDCSLPPNTSSAESLILHAPFGAFKDPKQARSFPCQLYDTSKFPLQFSCPAEFPRVLLSISSNTKNKLSRRHRTFYSNAS